MLRTVFLTACLLAGGAALAQNPPAASPANPTVPAVPTPAAPTTPPEKIAPSTERLSQQKGTITPPNVDPGMTVSPPANGAGKTPVIPPPGTPGGDRSVVPK